MPLQKTRAALDALLDAHAQHISRRILVAPEKTGCESPVEAFFIGNPDPSIPRAIIVGGVHGNERIGVDVVIAFLHSLLKQLEWDGLQQELFQRIRLVLVPVANPCGYQNGTRSNLDGIDMMRNAPVEAASAHWALGGQRLSRHLPWYRGKDLAAETAALIGLVQEETRLSPFNISVDCHSGFGALDRIWFPWAHKKEPLPHLAEVYALRNLFRSTYPNHVAYRIEPQCQHYMTHGDIWDYLYAESLKNQHGTLLPLTLEMGSWLWVRKNPWQIFNRHGLFNPLVPHRRRRILRQHLVFLNFILTALANRKTWLPNAKSRDAMNELAMQHWKDHFVAA